MNWLPPTTLSAPRPNTGFTLIELMLSIVIFAVVLTAINGVFFGAMQLRNRTTAMLERSLPVAQTVNLLRRDLAGIVAPSGLLSGSLKTTTGTGGLGQETSLEFYANTGVADEQFPWGEMQRISYVLRDATNRLSRSLGKDLVRLVSRNLLTTAQDIPEEQGLLTDVLGLEFSFYDGTQWRATWDSSTEQTILPKAIRVSLNLADDSEAQSPLTAAQRANPSLQLVVPILVTAKTNSTTSSRIN